jgi:hypothetical protein
MVPKEMAPGGGNMYGKDNTFGGYSNLPVVREDFVLNWPDVQVIPIDQINDAYDKVEKADVRFRYGVEMASLKPVLES